MVYSVGHKHSEQTKQKMRKPHVGSGIYKRSKEDIERLRIISHNGKGKKKPIRSLQHRINLSKSLKGRISPRKGVKFSEILLKKISGESSCHWKGGISKNPYPREFNYVLKLKIRERDNFTCCRCGRSERQELEELNRVLCVNHIDFNKNNLSEKNLNTLCLRCNIQINRERDYWTNYFRS